MSEHTTPAGVLFEAQRNAIEGTHEAFKRGVETQRELGETFVDFTPARQANERGYDAAHSLVDSYFDALASATPGSQDPFADVREAVDEQLDTLEATQTQAIETAEANARDGNESAASFLAAVDAALDDAFEATLDAHEDAEDQFATLEREVEEGVSAVVEDGAGAAVETTSEQVETASEQVEASVEAAGAAIEQIDGLGPTYAERLQAQGIDSIAALAQANAETVAEVADATRKQAEGWIEAAQSQG